MVDRLALALGHDVWSLRGVDAWIDSNHGCGVIDSPQLPARRP